MERQQHVLLAPLAPTRILALTLAIKVITKLAETAAALITARPIAAVIVTAMETAALIKNKRSVEV